MQNGYTYENDDVLSLQALASGDGFLDLYPSSQYVQNEVLETNRGSSKFTLYAPLSHTPVLRQTMTGTVYVGTKAVQTFFSNALDKFEFADLGTPLIKAVEGEMNKMTGEIALTWNSEPGENYCVVSYEYNMECQMPMPKKSALMRPTEKSLEEVTFEKFLSHEEVEELLMMARHVSVWDFNTSLGDSIKEKYETLCFKMMEMTNVLLRSGAEGYFWIVASPEIASIFETACHGFYPITSEEFLKQYEEGKQIPMKLHDAVQYRGLVHSKWRLYVDPNITSTQVLIGSNDKKGNPEHYARLSVANWII